VIFIEQKCRPHIAQNALVLRLRAEGSRLPICDFENPIPIVISKIQRYYELTSKRFQINLESLS